MSKVTREELHKQAKERSEELVRLTSSLIQIPSENPTGTQREVVDFVEKYLSDAGIAYEEVGENPEFPCIVAKIGSDEGFSVILNGHLDVVPAGDRSQWNFDPFCGTVQGVFHRVRRACGIFLSPGLHDGGHYVLQHVRPVL